MAQVQHVENVVLVQVPVKYTGTRLLDQKRIKWIETKLQECADGPIARDLPFLKFHGEE